MTISRYAKKFAMQIKKWILFWLFICFNIMLLSALKGPDQYLTVPFQFVNNQIVLQVSINSKGPFFMILDTGVYPSSVDIELARKLNIPLKKQGGYAAGFGSENYPYYPTEISTLKIGELEVKNLECIATRTRHIQLGSKKIDGILGHSFFKNKIVQINYLEKTVTLLEDWQPKHTSSQLIQPFHLVGRLPFINRLEVNGTSFRAMLDTGFSGALGMSTASARKLGLSEQSTEEIEAIGTRGKFTLRLGTVDKMGLGDFFLKHPKTFFFDTASYEFIGNDFFRHFLTTFDYVNNRLILEKLN